MERARRRRRVLTARACISFFLFHLVSELEVGAARFETRSDRCTRDYSDKNCATAARHERLTSPQLPAANMPLRQFFISRLEILLPLSLRRFLNTLSNSLRRWCHLCIMQRFVCKQVVGSLALIRHGSGAAQHLCSLFTASLRAHSRRGCQNLAEHPSVGGAA